MKKYILLLLCLLSSNLYAQSNQSSDSTEFVALAQLYLATGGDQWSSKTNWPDADSLRSMLSGGFYATAAEMATWEGITVRNGDVTGISLSAKALSGRLPDDLAYLHQLDSLDLSSNALTGALHGGYNQWDSLLLLDLSSNQITGLFALSSLANAGNLHIVLDQNPLGMDDLEALYTGTDTHPFASLSHASLVAPSGESAWETTVGEALSLSSAYTSATLGYQWEEAGSGTWTALSGETSSSYAVDVSAANAWARYRIAWTSSKITGLTTYSVVYRVRVDEGPQASNVPDGSTVAVATTTAPAAGSTDGLVVNFVRSYTAKEAMAERQTLLQARKDSAQVSTQYLDGLGRPLQTIAHEASPQGNDIIQLNYYDGIGRASREYLPYTATTTPATAGTYRVDGFREQHAYYQNQTDVAHSGYPYSETRFETAPTNRPLEKAAPGESWHMGSGHTLHSTWNFNTADDSIPLWQYGSNDSLYFVDFYAPGEVTLQESSDEHGVRSRAWQDKSGQALLNQNELDADTWVETAFIYDHFGRLRMVIQPEGMRQIRQSGDHSLPTDSAFQANWTFRYRYDKRGRQTEKILPGAAPVHTVYDPWDRPVLSQDGNLRAQGKWLFTKYDFLQRPVMTGFYAQTADRATLQSALDSLTEKYTEADPADTVIGYALDKGFPQSATAAELLSVSYYDHYRFPLAGDSSMAFAYPFDSTSTASPYVRGVATGSLTRVLGTDQWLGTLIWYDFKGRILQTLGQNHKGGQDRFSNRYDWQGQVLESRLLHTVPAQDSVQIVETFAYDHNARLLSATHQINAQPAITIFSNDYNELSQLIEKRLHDAGNPLQAINYQYNIRGWMTHINQADLSNSDDWFGMELHYDQGFSDKQYNGNIAGITWSTALDREARAFGYAYDALNRIKSAHYTEGAAYDSQVGMHNLDAIDYDHNGNILGLKRYGQQTDGSRQSMDVLSYGYVGNQLLSVQDAGWQDAGFTESIQDSLEYYYDANGNMVLDKNKGIDSIWYNHLNLPDSVLLQSGEVVSYQYDAAGIKLGRRLYQLGSLSKTTDYLGGFIYEQDSLQFVSTAEGRYLFGEARYEYFLKDHLGNTRLVVHTPEQDSTLLTMETINATAEEADWANVAETRQTDALHARTGSASSRLNADQVNTLPLGPTRTFKVTRGDSIDINAWAHYEEASNSSGFNFTLFITNTYDDTNSESLLGNLSLGLGFSGANGTRVPDVPYAYLKYIVYRADSSIAEEGEHLISSSANSNWEELALSTVIEEDGYIKVFALNEDAVNVWFDDISIDHKQSPIAQQTDYYPFGLEIAATQYNRDTWLENRFNRFQGQELDEQMGWVQFKWRNHQPAIGRFFNIDPLSEKYLYNSTYAFSENKVVAHVELEGLESAPALNGSTTESPPVEDDDLLHTLEVGYNTGLGFGAAFIDDFFFGLTNLRSNAAKIITEGGEQSFNFGQDAGDFAAMMFGGGEIATGLGGNVAGTVLIPFTGGVSVTVVVVGDVLIAHGAGVATVGAYNLINKTGRVYAKGNSGSNNQNGNSFDYGKYGSRFDDPKVEQQIRKDLKVPQNWISKPSNNNHGIRFQDPNNSNNHLRVMPGNKNSLFRNSQKPYTIRYKDGAGVDRFHKRIPNPTGKGQNCKQQLHVPIEDFTFKP